MSIYCNFYLEQIKQLSHQNKYLNWYIALCKKAFLRESNRNKAKLLLGYIESHHILPKSFNLGGEKDPNNLVHFTAKEHYIAHRFLLKFLKGKQHLSKMTVAWQRTMNSRAKKLYHISSNDYAAMKIAWNKNCTGENHYWYERKINGEIHPLTGRKASDKARQNMSIAQIGIQKGNKNGMYGYKFVIRLHDNSCIHIKKENLLYYLNNGYIEGKILSAEVRNKIVETNSGTIWIKHKFLKEDKRFKPVECSLFLSENSDWELGRHLDCSNRTIWIHNIITTKSVLIYKSELINYNKEWKRGKFVDLSTPYYKLRHNFKWVMHVNNHMNCRINKREMDTFLNSGWIKGKILKKFNPSLHPNSL